MPLSKKNGWSFFHKKEERGEQSIAEPPWGGEKRTAGIIPHWGREFPGNEEEKKRGRLGRARKLKEKKKGGG